MMASKHGCAGTLKKCALCLSGVPREAGHIIPHFVFRHLVKSGPTGFIRGHKNPNRRLQDGRKVPFLCPVCEDRFSKWEKTFAHQVFHPLHKHQVSEQRLYPAMGRFEYGDWLKRFCVSVSWRSLFDLNLQHEGEQMPFGDEGAAKRAMEIWRQYLLGERDSIDGFEQHLIVVAAPSETLGIRNTDDLRLYFERAVTNSVFHSPDEAYVFTKFCRLAIAGTIKDRARDWRGTIVKDGSGVFSADEQVLSGLFGSWVKSDLDGIVDARTRVSSVQRDLILSSAKRSLSMKRLGK